MWCALKNGSAWPLRFLPDATHTSKHFLQETFLATAQKLLASTSKQKGPRRKVARAGTGDIDGCCVGQVIGRSKEVARVVQVLARRSKNNPILLGDPGVGKTAIAEGLARAIVTGPPPFLHITHTSAWHKDSTAYLLCMRREQLHPERHSKFLCALRADGLFRLWRSCMASKGCSWTWACTSGCLKT